MNFLLASLFLFLNFPSIYAFRFIFCGFWSVISDKKAKAKQTLSVFFDEYILSTALHISYPIHIPVHPPQVHRNLRAST